MSDKIPSPLAKVKVPWAALALFLVIGGATVAVCLISPKPEASKESGVVLNLPNSIGKFWGIDQEVSEAEKTILPKDTQFAKKQYDDGIGGQINCQIVLSGADKRSIHRPEACLRGQGWDLETGKTIPITLNSGSQLKVTELTIKRPIEFRGKTENLTSLYLYWFVSKNGNTPYHWERIKKTNIDLLLHNITHRWAYIIVSAPVLEGFVPDGKNEEQTLEMLKKFIAELGPQIMTSEQSPTISSIR